MKGQTSFHLRIFQSGFFISAIIYLLGSSTSLLFAINVSEGIFETAKISLFLLTILCLYEILKRDSEVITQIIKALILANLVMLMASFWQYYNVTESESDVGNIWTHMKQISSTMANRNLLASGNLLMIPFVSYGIYKLKKAWKMLAICVLFYLLLSILFLQVRAVWLAMSVAVTTTGFAFLVYSKTSSNPFKKISNRIKPLLLLIPGLLIGLTMITEFPSVAEGDEVRSGTTIEKVIQEEAEYSESDVDSNSVTIRYRLWTKTLKMIQENPLFGVGLGNWKINLPNYGLNGLPTRAKSGRMNFQRPHNDFLWIWSETGFLGIFAYLAMFTFILLYISRILIKPDDQNNKIVGLLALFGIMAFLCFSFFSFPKERIFHNVMIITTIAWVLSKTGFGNANNPEKHKGGISKVLVLFILLVISATLLLGYNKQKSEIHARQVILYHAQQKWVELRGDADLIDRSWYSLDPASVPISWYIGRASFALDGPGPAVQHFKDAHAVHPYHLPTLINLGTCSELIGNHNEAIQFYKQAIEISPDFSEPILNLCAVLFNQGSIDEAYNILRTCKMDQDNSTYMKTLEVILPARIKELVKNTSNAETKNKLQLIISSKDLKIKFHELATRSKTHTDQLMLEYVD